MSDQPPAGTPPTPPPAPPPSGGMPGGGGTPAAGSPDLTKRFIARLIDWVGLFVVAMVFWGIMVAVAIADATSGGAAGGLFGFSFLGILLGLIPGAYFAGMLAFNNGKTIGKMLIGLEVRATDGTPLDIGRALRREWWNFLIVIPFIGGLATAGVAIYIAVTINSGTPWHDQQAGTIEVSTK